MSDATIASSLAMIQVPEAFHSDSVHIQDVDREDTACNLGVDDAKYSLPPVSGPNILAFLDSWR